MTQPPADPTAGLYLPPGQSPGVPLRYRSGRVLGWDTRTQENTVEVDGVEFENLPVLPGDWNQLIGVNDIVTLLATSDNRGATTYLVAGLPFTPPHERLERIPVDELVQRIDSSTYADAQNIATFLLIPTFQVTFRPGWAYKVDVQMNMYGLSASNYAQGSLYVGASGLAGTVKSTWYWPMPVNTSTDIVRKWSGHLRNTGGSPVTSYVSIAAAAAVNIGVGVTASAARVNYVEVTPIGPAGKFENAPTV